MKYTYIGTLLIFDNADVCEKTHIEAFYLAFLTLFMRKFTGISRNSADWKQLDTAIHIFKRLKMKDS